MTALSHSLHRDSQQSLPRRASSKNDRGLASGGPHISTASPTASQSTFEDYNLEGKIFLLSRLYATETDHITIDYR